MKKSFFAVILFVASTIFPGYALSTPPNNVIAKTKLIKEKAFEIRLANLEKKYTYLSITDMKGDLIYFSEGVRNHNGYCKVINIKNLVDGNYMLKVRSKGKVLRQIIKVSGEQVYFSNFK